MRQIILLSLIVFSIVTVPFSFGQSSSLEGNCPPGTKAEVKGTNIECIQISNVKRTCPAGTYQGLDNQGNFACRDIDTNQIVDPNTGLMYDSQTGEIILDNDQMMYVGIGIFVMIIIIAIAVKASSSSKSSPSKRTNYQNGDRLPFSESTKRQVMEEQDGRCNICNEIPKHWEFDHINGRADNSIDNCQGLCRDCHQKKTLDDGW